MFHISVVLSSSWRRDADVYVRNEKIKLKLINKIRSYQRKESRTISEFLAILRKAFFRNS